MAKEKLEKQKVAKNKKKFLALMLVSPWLAGYLFRPVWWLWLDVTWICLCVCVCLSPRTELLRFALPPSHPLCVSVPIKLLVDSSLLLLLLLLPPPSPAQSLLSSSAFCCCCRRGGGGFFFLLLILIQQPRPAGFLQPETRRDAASLLLPGALPRRPRIIRRVLGERERESGRGGGGGGGGGGEEGVSGGGQRAGVEMGTGARSGMEGGWKPETQRGFPNPWKSEQEICSSKK